MKINYGLANERIFLMIGIIKLVDASISLADNLIDFVIKHYDLISMVFYYKKTMKNYQERWIHKFELKKDKWVYVPSELTRSEGIKILNSLSTKWTPPVYFYHFRKGGHIEALKVHLDSYYFAYIDLKGFFNSTSRSRVSRALKEFYSYEQARNIAKMSTIKNPTDSRLAHILPFGFYNHLC